MPVLIYAVSTDPYWTNLSNWQGDADYICNWLGNNNWTDALDWYGSSQYRRVGLTDLRLGGDGEATGQIKSSGNLTFMRIFGAGHMVPTDQPEASLDFFNRWLHGEWAS